MLEGLDEIDWNSLRHCYGTAGDVPEQLRALRSPDPGERKAVRDELFGNLYHQGGAFEASAAAVPFLVELAIDPETPEREELLFWLNGFAVGYDEFVLPAGPHPGHEEYPPYAAIRDCVPHIRPLLWAGHDEVESYAVKLLAWFPAHAEESIEALWARLADAPPELAATCLVAIGLLGERGDAALTARLEPQLHHEDGFRRWGAAIALARLTGDDPPARTLEQLLGDALGAVPDFVEPGMPFHNGDMRAYAAESLTLLGPAAVEPILAALPGAEKWSGVWLAHSALDIAFEGPIARGMPFAALEPRRQQVLRALLACDWFQAQTHDDHVLRRYGLPADPAALDAYVRGLEPRRRWWRR